MVFQKVNASVPKTFQCLQVHWHDQPAPEIAQLLLRSLDPDFYFFDMGARLFEYAHRLADHFGNPRVDRKNIEIWAVGNLPILYRLAGCPREVGHLFEGVRVGGVISGKRIEGEGGIIDGARNRALEQERRVGGKRVRTYDGGDATERSFVAIDIAPRRGDSNRAAAVSPFGERQETVRDRS